MPSLSEKDRANLEAGLDAIRKIETFTKGLENADQFYAQEMIFDATLMNFVVIGEAVAKMSQDLQERYPGIPWPQIKSFRNIVTHNYFGVDAEEVWQIIHKHLPTLKLDILRILKESKPEKFSKRED